MTPKHPPGAITTKDELDPIIVLGLSVTVWDIDPGTLKEFFPTALTQGHKGRLIEFSNSGSMYARWFGFKDPTYNATEVLWSLRDDEINKAQAAQPSLYMFNTREEAALAFREHQIKEAARRNEWRKRYDLAKKA